MDLQAQITAIFQSFGPHEFNPSDCLRQCITLLEQACAVDGEYDPRSVSQAQAACNAYGHAAILFLQNQYSSAAVSILVEAWNRFSAIQRVERQRIYRAAIGMYLARIHLALADRGSAVRWALLTQADDLLGEHASGGGEGRHMLHTMLGMGTNALDELSKVADQNLSRIKAANDWSIPFAFAEDVITKFAFNNPELAQLFASPTQVAEFPLNGAYFRSLLDAVHDAVDTKAKGDSLEDVATYLFLLIPGLVPRRNLLDEDQAYETDIVVRNLKPTTNLASDLLGRYFLVECKNWEDPVGVRDIGYFLYRMRLTHARFGVIFAKNGITGAESQERAAYSLVRMAYHEDGNVCVVIDGDNLEQLRDARLTFWSMLLERMERMRFGRAAKTKGT